MGLVLGSRVLDIEGAHAVIAQEIGLRGGIEGIGTLRTPMRAAAPAATR